MGKKINPKVFRLNTVGSCTSRWFANKDDYAKVLEEDVKIRKFLKIKFREAGIAKIEIKRSSGSIEIVMHTSKPGVIIGRGGAGVEELKKQIKKDYFGSKKIKIIITITEVAKPDLDAELIYQNMAAQLEKRVPFRKVMKRAIEQVKRAGAKGVKICVAGRLNGVEIARTEVLTEGKIPTHTLRADIDYTRGKVSTIYGALGVKVWIYKGDVFIKSKKEEDKTTGFRNKKAAVDDTKSMVERKTKVEPKKKNVRTVKKGNKK